MEESLDTIEQSTKSGRDAFHVGSLQPFELGEIRRFAEELIRK
jgi:hypothetical protein